MTRTIQNRLPDLTRFQLLVTVSDTDAGGEQYPEPDECDHHYESTGGTQSGSQPLVIFQCTECGRTVAMDDAAARGVRVYYEGWAVDDGEPKETGGLFG